MAKDTVRHRTFTGAARGKFPYADYLGGDGPYAVVRKCARYYRRGYTEGWWHRWSYELFETHEEAETNLDVPCDGTHAGGYSWEANCNPDDHFIFELRLAKDLETVWF